MATQCWRRSATHPSAAGADRRLWCGSRLSWVFLLWAGLPGSCMSAQHPGALPCGIRRRPRLLRGGAPSDASKTAGRAVASAVDPAATEFPASPRSSSRVRRCRCRPWQASQSPAPASPARAVPADRFRICGRPRRSLDPAGAGDLDRAVEPSQRSRACALLPSGGRFRERAPALPRAPAAKRVERPGAQQSRAAVPGKKPAAGVGARAAARDPDRTGQHGRPQQLRRHAADAGEAGRGDRASFDRCSRAIREIWTHS